MKGYIPMRHVASISSPGYEIFELFTYLSMAENRVFHRDHSYESWAVYALQRKIQITF